MKYEPVFEFISNLEQKVDTFIYVVSVKRTKGKCKLSNEEA